MDGKNRWFAAVKEEADADAVDKAERRNLEAYAKFDGAQVTGKTLVLLFFGFGSTRCFCSFF